MASKRVVVIVLALVLTSCTASQHAGIVTINQPAASETDEAKWFAYYEDQLDGYGGDIEQPGPDAPEPARRGYERARNDWESRDGNAKLRTFLMCVPVGVVLGVLIGR